MNHELQVMVTVTLLVVAAMMAVISDVVRIRALRRAEAEPRTEIATQAAAAPAIARKTLVPEIPAPVVSNGRSSRLAASLKEKRRTLSPAAMAAIERGSKLARKGPAKVQPTPALQQVG